MELSATRKILECRRLMQHKRFSLTETAFYLENWRNTPVKKAFLIFALAVLLSVSAASTALAGYYKHGYCWTSYPRAAASVIYYSGTPALSPYYIAPNYSAASRYYPR